MSTNPEIIETKRPSSDYAFAGAVSGFLTRFICQPLDVIKIRFQVDKKIYIRCIYLFNYLINEIYVIK